MRCIARLTVFVWEREIVPISAEPLVTILAADAVAPTQLGEAVLAADCGLEELFALLHW